MPLFYIGMAHTSGVKGSVLMAVHVFFAILISAKLFRYERLNAPKLLGCLCGFGGVLLINLSGGGLGGGFTLLGTVRCCWRRWPAASPSRFSSGMLRERTP